MGTTNTTVSSSDIPDYILDFGEDITTAAVDYGLPSGDFLDYPTYDGSQYGLGDILTAPLNEWHTAGFDQAGDSATSYQPFMDAASAYASPALFGGTIDSGQFTQTADSSPYLSSGDLSASGTYNSGNTVGEFNTANLQRFMNPYTDLVMDAGLDEIQRQNSIAQNSIDSQAGAANMFGDARHGILNAEQDRNRQVTTNQFVSDTLNNAYGQGIAARQAEADLGYRDAGLRYQDAALRAQDANLGLQDIASNRASYLGNVAANQGDFDRTLQAYNSNLGAQQQGLAGLSGLASLTQQLQQSGANALTAVGDTIQGQEQSILDRAYQENQNQANYPFTVGNLLQGINTASPYEQNVTQSQQQGLGNTLLQAAGLGLGAYFSDETLKEDVKEVEDPEEILAKFRELGIYDYKYKDGDEKVELGLPEQRRGPMAQEYKQVFDADLPEVGGKLQLDVGDVLGNVMLAIKALDERTAENASA